MRRTAEQHWLEFFAYLGQILITEHFALFIHDAMMVVKTKRRAKPPVVDELHDRIQFVEPVFERRARQHEREPRTKPLDHAAGLPFPVLDALPFLQNDKVPI